MTYPQPVVSQVTDEKKRRAAWMREWRKTHPMTAEERLKDIARSKAGMAKRRGHLIQQPCEKCGDPNTEMHHDDYSKPLEVRWLCRPHHMDNHFPGPSIVVQEASEPLPKAPSPTNMSPRECILTLRDFDPALHDILFAVSSVTGIAVTELKSHRRSHRISSARFVFYAVARQITTKSFPQIGKACDRDHSTVMCGVHQVEIHKDKYEKAVMAVVERLGMGVPFQ